MRYASIIFVFLVLCSLFFSLGGCTVTTGCYGYGCGIPYNYGFDAQRFNESGTRQPVYYHYRPGY